MSSLERAKEVLHIEAEGITAVIDQLDADFDKAIVSSNKKFLFLCDQESANSITWQSIHNGE